MLMQIAAYSHPRELFQGLQRPTCWCGPKCCPPVSVLIARVLRSSDERPAPAVLDAFGTFGTPVDSNMGSEEENVVRHEMLVQDARASLARMEGRAPSPRRPISIWPPRTMLRQATGTRNPVNGTLSHMQLPTRSDDTTLPEF